MLLIVIPYTNSLYRQWNIPVCFSQTGKSISSSRTTEAASLPVSSCISSVSPLNFCLPVHPYIGQSIISETGAGREIVKCSGKEWGLQRQAVWVKILLLLLLFNC